MATYKPTYASTSDLRDIYPNIDKYDVKTQLLGWTTTGTANLYLARNTGLVNQLFADGEDLGDAEANSGVVDTNGEWYYDSNLDTVYYFNSASNPIDLLMEGGEDWATHQTDMLYKASRYFDSYVDPTLPTQMWKNDENEYDYIVIRTTAQICAYFLLSSHDPENEDALKIKEEYESILDRINAGGIKLGFEKSADSSQGIITELSANASSTLKPVDLRGKYRGSVYDKVRLQVITGGVIGTATYSVWVNGNDKLGINQGSQVVTAEKITGTYQTLSGGLQVRFGGSTPTGVSGGTADLLSNVATADDVYQIEVWAVGEELDDARGIRSAYMTRS